LCIQVLFGVFTIKEQLRSGWKMGEGNWEMSAGYRHPPFSYSLPLTLPYTFIRTSTHTHTHSLIFALSPQFFPFSSQFPSLFSFSLLPMLIYFRFFHIFIPFLALQQSGTKPRKKCKKKRKHQGEKLRKSICNNNCICMCISTKQQKFQSAITVCH